MKVVDVAVVGGGLAGLTCAVRAAMSGRKAIVLERSPEPLYPCNSRIATGVFHVAYQSIATEAGALMQRLREVLGPGAHEGQMNAVCNGARRAVEWLKETAGAQFVSAGAEPMYQHVIAPSSVGKFGRQWQGRGPDLLLQSLEKKLTALGGELRRGAAVHRLTPKGVEGDHFEVRARNVVIADGGFQTRYTNLLQRNARTGRGDGLRMAREAGAAFADRGGFYGHLQSRSALEDDRLWPYPWADELARASIVVGSDGRRIADERLGGIYLANKIAALPDPASTCVICDQRAWEGPGAERVTSPNPQLERMGGALYRSDSLQFAGIDAAGLKKSVEEFNAGNPAWPIRQAPFYAMPIVPGITYTLGGISIDGDARALREDGTPIPGLYAVGSTSGGLEGGERVGYVGGLIKAVVTGLCAAEHLSR
jgi:fumarate reductase flavoprotein subunit